MAAATPGDFCRLKLLHVIENAGKDVLTFILKSGTHAPTIPPGVRLDDYLRTLPDNSKANYVLSGQKKKNKNPFDKSEMHQIMKYPLWDNFDITLITHAIRLACEGVANDNDKKWQDQNEMEGLIRQIKNERNALIHEVEQMTETEFQAKLLKFQNLFVKTLYAAKARYKVPDTEFTPVRDKALLDISKIRQMEMEKVIAKELWTFRLPDFIQESQKHLKGLYGQAQYFDPLSFLSGAPQGKIHIQSIFCKAFLMGQTQDNTKTRDIESRDILTLIQPVAQSTQPSTSSQATQFTQAKNPQFVMIRGVAGSGKTTLLTFILSEWLKDPQDCNVKHLTDYDIVLRILCREKDGPTLQDFLKQTLPNFFTIMEENLVTLLKECKVLFLIDGLDELSRGSLPDQLVTDIVSVAKEVPEFTIICTSRPETVDDFVNTLPAAYQQWKMEMQGVYPEHRTDFVLTHYNSLPSHSNKDPDKLGHLMDCIGWRDHFGLPLNLLFVATLFYTEPDCVKDTTTQTSLYITMHEWCVQKLQSRLAGHPKAETDRLAREDSINRVLKVMYDVSLQAVLQDRLNLSVDDARCLRESCEAKKLPSTEVMGAFLCLRETIVKMVPHQRYSAPHKSLQEFYAAHSIVTKLHEGACVGGVRRLLHDPSRRQVKKFRNLLLHVAGLLSQPDTPPLPAAIQEVVDMLAETGMKGCGHWLSLLEDTEVNSTVLKCVARHITSHDDDDNLDDNDYYGDDDLDGYYIEYDYYDDNYQTVTVGDSTITSAANLLPLIPHKKVRIEVHRKESDVNKITKACTSHTCIEITLWHQYKYPHQHQAAAADSLLRSLPTGDLEVFLGQLSGDAVMLLKRFQRLTHLHLAVTDDQHAQTILSAISNTYPSLPVLQYLILHIPVRAVTPDTLTTRLPDCDFVNLVLSGMDETMLERARRIAAALQPIVTRSFWSITFPGCCLEVDGWKRFLDELCNAGVRVNFFIKVTDNNPMTKEEEEELDGLAKTRMLSGFKGEYEDEIWT